MMTQAVPRSNHKGNGKRWASRSSPQSFGKSCFLQFKITINHAEMGLFAFDQMIVKMIDSIIQNGEDLDLGCYDTIVLIIVAVER